MAAESQRPQPKGDSQREPSPSSGAALDATRRGSEISLWSRPSISLFFDCSEAKASGELAHQDQSGHRYFGAIEMKFPKCPPEDNHGDRY